MQPGDILAVRGTSWLSGKILAATGNTVSHVGMIVGTNPPIVIEALNRVMTRPLSASIAAAEKAYLFSDNTLTSDQRITLVETAAQFSADGYNYGDILLQGMDAVFTTTYFTDHLSIGLNRDPICSYLVASAYKKLNLTFGKKPLASITPADIFAFCTSNAAIYLTTQIK